MGTIEIKAGAGRAGSGNWKKIDPLTESLKQATFDIFLKKQIFTVSLVWNHNFLLLVCNWPISELNCLFVKLSQLEAILKPEFMIDVAANI